MTIIDWQEPALRLRFVADEDAPVRLVEAAPELPAADDERYARVHQPLVEVLTPGHGQAPAGQSQRHSGSHLGRALRYVTHTTSRVGAVEVLVLEQRDPVSGLVARSRFEAHDGVAAVRCRTELTLAADAEPLTVFAVTSLATGLVVSDDLATTTVWRGASTWSAEARWASAPLRSAGLAHAGAGARGETAMGAVTAVSTSTWSSGTWVPAGAVTAGDRTLAWQVEHNGAWSWEVGERPGWSAQPPPPDAGGLPWEVDAGTVRFADGAYLAVLGPSDRLHAWSLTVQPGGAPFVTVPVTFAVAAGFEDAFAGLTAHRRAARRTHAQDATLPVVFNDYMNTLNGDPSSERLRPLVDAAAAVGCEYFCIDAGWYDDTDGWWASVGDWEPSTVRFPDGIGEVLDRIRERGMVPGLWLEPEVVGLTSAAARTLPDSAFLQRGGVRVREKDRYLLDLRSPDARAHLDRCVDRLVGELGVGYFKLDYNVIPGSGTDLDAESVGDGLLQHNRALLDWLGSVLDRHPDLVLENCGSGALRADAAMLGVLQLQSTSDQTEPLLYPAIAVGSLLHVLPEQAANWAYPQATMGDEEIAFTMVTGLAGRLYQAGLLDRMDEAQRALVAAGVQAHRDTRHALARSVPRFPTGLPDWDDAWVTVAFDAGDETYLLLWRRADAAASVEAALPHLDGADLDVTQVYPPLDRLPAWDVERTPAGLRLTPPHPGVGARMLRVAARPA
ncbi:alpha-galactosidase [Friedmanniella luteola]|uniref:Alpha-galactosidase n=1 Tax=Friedmanniella luteola TaxID=546871 RepID=A0A1H1LYL9_9ACTN|nr:glycoside hydrolase family 36 protein [Friedmanniella luteola]SDR79322.1 alpha-galactosidase [Friedmanniella luteola]